MPILCTPSNLTESSKCLENCLMEEQLWGVSTWLLTQIDSVPANVGDLVNASRCFMECLETGQLLTIKAWLLTKLAGDSNSPEILTEARCFDCLTARQQDALQAWLLAQKAGVSTDPEFLFSQSRCLFSCLTWQQQLGIQVYLLAVKAGQPIVPATLLESARCFVGCLDEGQANSVITLELCHWNNAGGGCPTITLHPATLPDGTCATDYSQLITATGGSAPYTFAVTAGALPGGTFALAAGGLLTGNVTGSGTFNFTVTATDAVGCTGTIDYALSINAKPLMAELVTFSDFQFFGDPSVITTSISFDGEWYTVEFTSPDFVCLADQPFFVEEAFFIITCDPCFLITDVDTCLNGTDSGTGSPGTTDSIWGAYASDYFVDFVDTNTLGGVEFGPVPFVDPVCSGDYAISAPLSKYWMDVVLLMKTFGGTTTVTSWLLKFKLTSV